MSFRSTATPASPGILRRTAPTPSPAALKRGAVGIAALWPSALYSKLSTRAPQIHRRLTNGVQQPELITAGAHLRCAHGPDDHLNPDAGVCRPRHNSSTKRTRPHHRRIQLHTKPAPGGNTQFTHAVGQRRSTVTTAPAIFLGRAARPPHPTRHRLDQHRPIRLPKQILPKRIHWAATPPPEPANTADHCRHTGGDT